MHAVLRSHLAGTSYQNTATLSTNLNGVGVYSILLFFFFKYMLTFAPILSCKSSW